MVFPEKSLTYILIYGGLFCFLAVCVYFYDKIMKKKQERALRERVKKLRKK